jgi:hypothetical protein
MALAVADLAGGSSARADPLPSPADPPPATACGFPLGVSTYGVWRDLGADQGRLGCPTTTETATAASPEGTAARVTLFGLKGEIVEHAGGPRAGQAYAVNGCFYRLYVQFGGTSGWLGLPVSAAENTPDGSTQAFEGGSIRYTRAYDDCEATRGAPATPEAPLATPTAAAGYQSLDLYENPMTGDRLSLATDASIAEAATAGYKRLRPQARVIGDATPGTARLKHYANPTGDRREVVATDLSQQDAIAEGLAFEAGQGWVWIDARPGAVPVKRFRDPVTGKTRLTVGEADESEAVSAGYRFVRVEGYALPPA